MINRFRTFFGISLYFLLICSFTAVSCKEKTNGTFSGEKGINPDEISWKPAGLSGGGAMFTPAISAADPDLMMINCDMSAAYISEDGGRNWRMINHAQLKTNTRCKPCFHPTNPDIIYAVSGGSLKVSRDRGVTFTKHGELKQPVFGEMAIHPDNPDIMLAGMREGGCLISRDAGLTWSECNGPKGNLTGFVFDRTSRSGGKVIFAGTDAGIWQSDNGGDTWIEKTKGIPWLTIHDFSGASVPGGDLIILYCSIESRKVNGEFRGGIYRSTDRGNSWEWSMGEGINMETEKADEWAGGEIAQYRQLLVTDKDPGIIYATNTSTGFHPPHHSTVYKSTDAGKHWKNVFFMDPRFEKYNVADNYVTASNGQSYSGGGTPLGVAICNSDPGRILMVYTDDAYATHDGGQSWFSAHTYPAEGQKPQPGSAWVCNGLVVTTTWNYYIDPHQPDRHYIAYTDIGFARSTDRGESWIWWNKHTWAPWRNTCYEIAFDPDIPGKMWGAFSNVHDIPNDNIISERHRSSGPGGVCISRNFGESWMHEAKGIPEKAVTSIVLDPESPENTRTLYAGVFMEGVYKSTDDGKTWTLKKEGLGHPENMRVSRLFLHKDGTLFAMVCARRAARNQPLMPEGVGLYRSQDKGEHWEKVNESQLFLYPKDFSVHPENSDIILVGVCDPDRQEDSGGLYRTKDGGKSWERIGRKGNQTFGGYFHPKHDGWIFMTLTEGAPGCGLWLSRDDGTTWEPFSGLPFSNIQRVHFDPEDPDAIIVTTFGGSVWKGR